MGKHTDTTKPLDGAIWAHRAYVPLTPGKHVDTTRTYRPREWGLDCGGKYHPTPEEYLPEPCGSLTSDAWSDDPDRTTRRGDTTLVYYPGRNY